MKPQSRPSLKDITRIVINRIAVWEVTHACNETDNGRPVSFWHKIEGGPGFDPAHHGPATCKNYPEMIRLIDRKLNKTRVVPCFTNRDLELYECEPAYKWWISGNTLNIVRKEFPKKSNANLKSRIMREFQIAINSLEDMDNSNEDPDPLLYARAVEKYETLFRILQRKGAPIWCQ